MNEQTCLSNWIYAFLLKSTHIVSKYHKDIAFR